MKTQEYVPITHEEFSRLVTQNKTLLRRLSKIGRFKRIDGQELASHKAELQSVTETVNSRIAGSGIASEIESASRGLQAFSGIELTDPTEKIEKETTNEPGPDNGTAPDVGSTKDSATS